ncbi:MAG: hypothetical protein WBX00_28340 [Isosphaeraceae bacterium]
MSEEIDRCFPELAAAGYVPTSDRTIVYNCIAWAAADETQWWECDTDGPINKPGCYWPPNAKHGVGIDALISAYETRGYTVCEDSSLESGFEKVALYAEHGEWRHAAKQLTEAPWSGCWSIKLGDLDDVRHVHPNDASGEINGHVICFMKRRIAATDQIIPPASAIEHSPLAGPTPPVVP